MGFMTSQTGWRSYGPTLPSDVPAGLSVRVPCHCPSPPGMGALADTTVSLQTLLYAALAGAGIWGYFKISAAQEKANRIDEIFCAPFIHQTKIDADHHDGDNGGVVARAGRLRGLRARHLPAKNGP